MADYTGATNKFGNAVGIPFSSFATEEAGMIDLAFAADDLRRMNDMFWLDGIRRDSADWSDGDGAVRWSNGFNVFVRPFRGHVNGTIVFAPQLSFLIEEEMNSERIDTVLIQRDYQARTVNVMVRKGESGSGAPPVLAYNDGGTAEYALAHIMVNNLMTSLSQADIIDARTALVADMGIYPTFKGKIDLLPIRPENLAKYAPGWHFCNGDMYPVSSSAGGALFSLPPELKEDFGIIVSGNYISIPNMFYSDGRGYFLRAADGMTRLIGTTELDGIPLLSGTISCSSAPFTNGTGVFTKGSNGAYRVNDLQSNTASPQMNFSSSPTIAATDEVLVINKGMTPAIFLGV